MQALKQARMLIGYCASAWWKETCSWRYQGWVCGQYRYASMLYNFSSNTWINSLELFYDRGHHQEFLSLSQELAAPGEMRQAQTFDFLFKNVEKQYESYQGINVKLRCADLALIIYTTGETKYTIRYFVRVSISRRIADVTKEKDVWVHSYRMPPDSNNSIKMEVGIEDCLHIEFEYNKSKWGNTTIWSACYLTAE